MREMTIREFTEWEQLYDCVICAEDGVFCVESTQTSEIVSAGRVTKYMQELFDEMSIDILVTPCVLCLLRDEWGAWINDVIDAHEHYYRRYRVCDEAVRDCVVEFYEDCIREYQRYLAKK